MQKQTTQTLSIVLFVTLLLWGVYTLINYLGVPVHAGVLLTTDALGGIDQVCDSTQRLCVGFFSFFPFLIHAIGRMGPLFGYGVFSLLLLGGVVAGAALRTGHLRLQFMLRPWHVIGLFFLSIFLIFSTLAFGSVKVGTTSGAQVMPLRQVVTPSAEVYRTAGAEALERLLQNFQELDDAGCLIADGMFTASTPKFLIRSSCIYGAFIQRVVSQFLFILVVLFQFLVVGRMVLQRMKLSPSSSLTESIVSIALGACVWIAILWFLAVFAFLKPFAVLGIATLLFGVGWRHVRYWFQQLLRGGAAVDIPWYHPVILLLWLLLTYLAFNFLTVIRPFPIGWDDLGSYINRPRLMVSYGHFIHTMSSFQWEYLTSLGFILFGYASVFGATTAIVINWMAGLLAVLSVFLFGRTFLGRGRGLLSALLYYALPIIGHFSFADMKIDNAVFTMGTLGTFTLFLYLFGSDEERGNWRWLALAGFFSGIAFSMKITATMVVAANGAVLLGALLHPLAFAGGMMGALTVFGLQGNLDFAKIGERIGGIFTSLFSSGAFLAMFLGTVVCLALAIWKAPAKLKPAFRAMLLFIAWFALALFPWVVHNNILFGNTIPRLELNAPNPNSAQFDLAGKQWGEASQNPLLHSLPPELAVNTKAPECEPTGHLEELDRYWGFRHGWEHYITLPWRMVMNLDSAGYYVTTAPILLLFPLLLLLPFFWRPEGRWLRWLFLSTLFILLQWILLGNGVPWYGIGVFLGLVIGIEALVARAPDMPNRIVIICFVTLSLLVMFSNRLWQFEMQRNLFEYPMGKVSYEALRERTIPHYNDIADIAVERHTALPERPFLYRVGTFIPYFVPKNLDVIGIADHQLDTFNCINQEHDAGLTTQRLKALGFNSMVIDTNTATIERDPNGTLHKKVQALFDYLNSPNSGLQGVISDSDGGVVFVLISP